MQVHVGAAEKSDWDSVRRGSVACAIRSETSRRILYPIESLPPNGPLGRLRFSFRNTSEPDRPLAGQVSLEIQPVREHRQ
jgi:hypothetical protein